MELRVQEFKRAGEGREEQQQIGTEGEDVEGRTCVRIGTEMMIPDVVVGELKQRLRGVRGVGVG